MIKILFATDGSESSLKAAAFTADLLKEQRPMVTLLHVFSVPTIPAAASYAPTGNNVDWDKVIMEMEDASREVLSRTEKVFAEHDIQAQSILVRGRPADEICQQACEGNYDLVVVASHGESNIKHVLLGSVSEGVTHRCEKPVLIVK